jgi:Flp pilus assembly protein CpaB
VKANPGARTVTLAVTQEQAQLLALVQAKGELALSLRSFGDKAPVAPPETDLIPYGAVRKTPSP